MIHHLKYWFLRSLRMVGIIRCYRNFIPLNDVIADFMRDPEFRREWYKCRQS